MKLFHSPASPYARKVRACAIAREIDNQIELVEVDPNRSTPELLAVNPLSKIPALVTEDGVGLYDSPVICEYLDSLGEAAPMFPRTGGPRWRALLHQAQGDGIMDAAVRRRGDQMRPREEAREALMQRQQAAVERMLAALEHDPPHRVLDIGSIAVACALGYLDFRFAAEPWRGACPRLTEWFVAFCEQPALAHTMPREMN